MTINLTKKQLSKIKLFLYKYEEHLFDKYDLKRDEDFHPYYYDRYLGKFFDNDELVQEVVNLDDLLSILDSVR